MAKKKTRAEENIHAVEEALSKTELFIEKNQKILSIVIGAILVLVLAFFAYKKLYLAPKEKEAQAQMFMAESYFDRDSLSLALNGDGNYLGFLDIIDDYGITKSGNLARYYAGICYLKLGEYDNAIDYLKRFKSKGEIVSSMAIGAIGDAYMEMGDTEKAATYYMEAADYEKNEFSTPLFYMKAGKAYEFLGNYRKALEIYTRIQDEYKGSAEARSIEKYIARVKTILGE